MSFVTALSMDIKENTAENSSMEIINKISMQQVYAVYLKINPNKII